MDSESLERLKKRLYKKGEMFRGRFQEPELPYRREKISSEWNAGKEEGPEEILATVLKESRFKKMKFIIWTAIVFVLGLAVLAAFYLFGDFGTVSSKNIDITISAPEEVAGGDLIRWEVTIHNKNKVKLASAELAFKYPDGSRPINRLPGAFLVEKISLGEVPADGVVRHTFIANIFGPEEFESEAEVKLEYRTEGSNAIFEKIEKKPIKIIRSPIGVSIIAPKEINAGREVGFRISYVSNSSEVLRALSMDVVYPDGFTFKEATPRPAEGQNRWTLGDLAPGESGEIVISGVFEGEDLLQKNITAFVGILDGRDLVVYGAETHPFTLRKMFIELTSRINNRDDVTFLKVGDTVSIEVLWKNNLAQAIRDATVEVLIEGGAIDERSISVSSGSYRGFEKKAVWSPSSLRELSLINPGGTGKANFSLRILDASALSRARLINPILKLSGEIRPGVLPQGVDGTDISGRFDIELKIETELQLSSRGFYYLSALPGSGPLPPRVGQETVYTVVWTLASLTNNASGVLVRAALPAYVRWKGEVSPSGEPITFDPVKSEVVWRPDNIGAGVGITQPAREVSFRIGIVPSLNQVNSAPVLLFDITASGRDDFTGGELKDSASSLTTDITRTDDQTKVGDDRVQP